MFEFISINNPFHVYKIEGNKIIRDDYLMSFDHPDAIKSEYIKLPSFTYEENNAIIASLKNDIRFKSMVIALFFNHNKYSKMKYINNITDGDYTDKVKKVLNLIYQRVNELSLT